MANDYASPTGKNKVALVELANSDLDIFHRYTQSDDWEPELIIVNGPGTHAERMARILGLPVHEFPHRELLARCDLIVIGDPSSQHYVPIREMMAGTKARVVLLQDLRAELDGAAQAATAPEEPKDEIDRALDLLMAPDGPVPGRSPFAGGSLLSFGNAPGHPAVTVGPEGQGQSRSPASDFQYASGDAGTGSEDSGLDFEVDPAYAGTGEVEGDSTPSDAPPEESLPVADTMNTEFAGSEAEDTFETDVPETFETTEESEAPLAYLEESTETGDPVGGASVEREVLQPTPGAEPRFLIPEPVDAEGAEDAEDVEDVDLEATSDLDTDNEAPASWEAEMESQAVPGSEAETGFEPEADFGTEPSSPEPVEPEAQFEPEPVLSADTEDTFEPEPQFTEDPEAAYEPEPVFSEESEAISEPEPRLTEASYAAYEPDPTPESPARADAPSDRFDLSLLLGRDLSRSVGALPIDATHAGLTETLQDLRSATGAKAISLMLPEAGGDYLRIAAAAGLSPETIANSRFQLGEGLAGTAFSRAELQTQAAELPGFAEDGGSILHKLAVGLPLTRDGRAVGVLFVTLESGDTLDPDGVVQTLAAAAESFLGLILEAVDLTALDLETIGFLLSHHLDRIMALETPFAERLLAVGELLRSAVRADFTHLYLVDSANRRLEAVSEPAGMTSASGGYLPLEQGVFGWALDQGEPMLSGLSDASGREHAIAYLPIHVSGPYGILVLENFIIEAGTKSDVLNMLGTVIQQLEDIYQVEQSVTSHDVASEIQLRIAEKSASLEVLPPDLRIQPTLEIVVQELGAEAAVWIASPDATPVLTQPRNREAARIVADAWDHLTEYGDWIRERGSAAIGRTGSGWEVEGPQAPAPFVGAREEGGRGTLCVFFAAAGGNAPSLPAAVLINALRGVCDLLQASPKLKPVHFSGIESAEILDPIGLTGKVREEMHRSGRSGKPFAVTRFAYIEPEGASMEHHGFLRHFLLTHKRGSDTLAELEGGFILISPEADPTSGVIAARFQDTWAREGSQLSLSVQNEDPVALAEAEFGEEDEARRAA